MKRSSIYLYIFFMVHHEHDYGLRTSGVACNYVALGCGGWVPLPKSLFSKRVWYDDQTTHSVWDTVRGDPLIRWSGFYHSTRVQSVVLSCDDWCGTLRWIAAVCLHVFDDGRVVKVSIIWTIGLVMRMGFIKVWQVNWAHPSPFPLIQSWSWRRYWTINFFYSLDVFFVCLLC